MGKRRSKLQTVHPAPAPAQARDRWIVIQVRRITDRTESRGLEPRISPNEIAWYAIADTIKEGPIITEIYRDLPPDQPEGTSCVQLDRYLFEVGAPGSTTEHPPSTEIRRLDIFNSDEGWKSFSLPFHSPAKASAVAAGNFLYVIPEFRDCKSTQPWGFVYDVIWRKSYEFKPPEGLSSFSSHACVPVSNHPTASGLLVPVRGDDGKQQFFYHDATEDDWRLLDNLSPEFTIGCGPRATFNGDLYEYDAQTAKLNVFDLLRTSFICEINLPLLENFDPEIDEFLSVMAVADYKLCLLWIKSSSLYYAKISVTHNPPGAYILKEADLGINDIQLVKSLPLVCTCEYCLDCLGEEEWVRNHFCVSIGERKVIDRGCKWSTKVFNKRLKKVGYKSWAKIYKSVIGEVESRRPWLTNLPPL